ncbi:Ureidoglycolate lyase [compost metagenome]
MGLITRLNGEIVQQGNTADMIFDVAELISVLSEALTLEPGDLIVSGTPAGIGWARKPPLFMKPGDLCTVEIEGIGTLSNPIADEASRG